MGLMALEIGISILCEIMSFLKMETQLLCSTVCFLHMQYLGLGNSFIVPILLYTFPKSISSETEAQFLQLFHRESEDIVY